MECVLYVMCHVSLWERKGNQDKWDVESVGSGVSRNWVSGLFVALRFNDL